MKNGFLKINLFTSPTDHHCQRLSLSVYSLRRTPVFSKSVNTDSLLCIIYHLKATDQLISKITSAAMKDVVNLRNEKMKNFKNMPTA